jgi:hypothetical protein
MNERIHLSLGGETEIENRADWRGRRSGDERRESDIVRNITPQLTTCLCYYFHLFSALLFQMVGFFSSKSTKNPRSCGIRRPRKKPFQKKKRAMFDG